MWQVYSFQVFGEKVWRMNRSAKGLIIVTTTSDGFSFANHRQFEFAKLSHFTVL